MKSRAIRKIVALVIIAALAVTMAFTLAACNDGGMGLGTGDIAVLVPNADHGWTGAVMSYAQAYADQLNAEGTYSVRVITSSSAENQMQQIEDIATNKSYKAVAILPYNTSVGGALEQLVNNDIPFVMCDRIVTALEDAAVGTVRGNNEMIGELTAQAFIEDYDMQNGDKVAIFFGDSSSVPLARNDGFYSVLAENGFTLDGNGEYPNVYESAPTEWSRSTARTYFTNWIDSLTVEQIQQYNYIFTHDDEIAMGIIEALDSGDIDAAKRAAILDGDVVLASSSGLQEIYNVMSGKVSQYTDEVNGFRAMFSVTYPPEMIEDAIQMVVDYLNGDELADGGEVIVPVELIDQTEAATAIGFK